MAEVFGEDFNLFTKYYQVSNLFSLLVSQSFYRKHVCTFSYESLVNIYYFFFSLILKSSSQKYFTYFCCIKLLGSMYYSSYDDHHARRHIPV